MSTSSEWASVYMGGAQFAAGVLVAYYTLRRQHRELIAQRDGAWFHLVVADKTAAELTKLVEIEDAELDDSARRCQLMLKSGNHRAVIDDFFRAEIASFKTRLSPIQRKVTQLALLFDDPLYRSVSEKFRDLEDQVTEWFDRLQSGRKAEREELVNVFCGCQRRLLESFREFEFVTLPNQRRQFQRSDDLRPGMLVLAGIAIGTAEITLRRLGASASFKVGEASVQAHFIGFSFWIPIGFAVFFVLLGVYRRIVVHFRARS